jgi:hypothetical protein
VLAGLEEAGNAEVNQLQAVVGHDHDVGRLQVAEDDRRLLAVEIVEDVAQLVGPGDNAALRKRPFAAVEHLLQGAAGHILHHQVVAVADGKLVADRRQVGVAQAAQQLRFASELGHGHRPVARVDDGRVGHLLQGHDAVLVERVGDQVDRAHAAAADDADDDVAIVNETVGPQPTRFIAAGRLRHSQRRTAPAAELCADTIEVATGWTGETAHGTPSAGRLAAGGN